MQNSTTKKDRIIYILSVLFWLFCWQILSLVIGEDILLVSPLKVLVRIFELLPTKEFWTSILFTCSKIGLGLLLALALSTVLAVLSHIFKGVEILLKPLVSIISATPVASIVILILIWVSSRNLSTVVSCMMAFPVLYTNILQGIKQTPKELLEVSKVFKLKKSKTLKTIYAPSIFPYFTSALTASIGLCWKSGVAAEIIGLPNGSIGDRLYQAKIYLATADIFAWTVVIIVLFVSFNKGLNKLFSYLVKKVRG